MTRIAADTCAEYERIAVVFGEVGPDAPGGAGDWTAGDVAAHLRSQFLGRGLAVFAARSLIARGVRLTELARPLHDPLIGRRPGPLVGRPAEPDPNP